MRGRAFDENGFGLLFPWIDLVNSEYRDGFGNRTEFLDDEDWVKSFSAHWGFCEEAAEVMSESEVREFRAWLRRIAERLAADQPLTDGDLEVLNGYLGPPVRRCVVRRDDAYALDVEPLTGGQPYLLAEVAASVARMLEHHEVKRLKACANPECRWVFYDETRGNVRVWCKDRTCGNRHRVRRFRDKRPA